MTHRPLCEFSVASCSEDGGIYRLALTESLEVVTLSKIPLPLPMYAVKENGAIHAVLRSPFKDSSESGVISISVESGEILRPLRKTGGLVGCHVSLLDGEPLVANYSSASVLGAGGRLIKHTGGSVNPKRQSEPHPHFVMPTPSGRYFVVCDLGLDRVLLYDKENNPVSFAALPAGSGPRHLCFDEKRKRAYVICEMGGCICTLKLDEEKGEISLKDTLPLAKDAAYPLSGAAIKLSENGERLYATERKTEKVYILSISDEGLELIGECDTEGKEPRDFSLLEGGYAAVCNQFSDSVVIFKLDGNGIPKKISSSKIKGAIWVN